MLGALGIRHEDWFDEEMADRCDPVAPGGA